MTMTRNSFLLYLFIVPFFQETCVGDRKIRDHFRHSPTFGDILNKFEDTSDFDVVHPVRLDDNGRFLTHDVHYFSKIHESKKHSRRRRHTHEHLSHKAAPRLLYKIPRGDHIITLNLTANPLLIPEDFVIERIKTTNSSGGDSMTSSLSKGTQWPCHFRGHVEGQHNSRVALSTCNGLTGLLITEEGDFFIEPIRDSTQFTSSSDVDPRSQAHKIYRRDLSSILDKSEPMMHYEKLVHDDELARSKHTNHDFVESQTDANDVESEQMDIWSAIFDEPHEKEFCGVSDTNRKYRRIIRKREQWEAKRESGSSGNERPRDGGSSEGSRRRSRRSVSVKRMIEMLVVVDKKMVEHYEANENGGVERYVLTIINMVSEIFHEASIGNSLEISLVRLILLEDEKKGPKITRHAENTLDSFCRWAKKVNPKDDSHPNHHDVAVLLTRQEICSQSNKSCETLGLAHVAGMCQSHRSCNVNQDTGLSLAYTVAHELGHNFAMHHDGQLNDCKPSPKYNHVMAPHLTSSSLPMIWSSCSRKYITRFLDRNWGFCLNDDPTEHDEFTPPTTLPGVVYDADHQCRLMFGEKSRYCSGIDDVCHRLWCYHGGTCRSRLHAAAPGTKCGKAKWCYDGKCISMSKEVKVIDGGWGMWSSWSTCSRTCGIGVSSSMRYCDNPVPQNGGQYCVGERKRYKTCSKWRCRKSPGSMTFREQQCASFNNVKYRNMTFNWKPVDSALYPCELHCYTRAGKIPFADRLRDKVIDGTKCFPRSDDICVDGICRRVGCDKNIGSRALEDRCGVCHGNGSTCFEVNKLFGRKKGEEYTPIALLPLGARNIEISEVAPVMNFLALRHATNKTQYYLNGNYMIQWDTKFQLAGTQFTYRRVNETVDKISAPGPLTEEIMVVVLFVEENPGVSIEYSKPYVYNPNKSDEEEFPEFKWKVQDWSECSRECGKGHQIISAICVEKKAGIVEDFFCNVTERPEDKKRFCNDDPCPARWWSAPWEDCSVTCGSDTGIQKRLVMCVRSVGEGDQIALNYSMCSELARPTNKRRCQPTTEIPCPMWRPSEWEQCSETCGGGIKNRTVECVTYVMNEVIDLGNLDDDSNLMEIEEIEVPDINIGGEISRKKSTKQSKKNSKRKNSKHGNLLRGKGLLMSIELDSLLHDIDADLDGYDVEKDELCDSAKKPVTQKICNTVACPTTTSPIVETSVGLDWTMFSQFIDPTTNNNYEDNAIKHSSDKLTPHQNVTTTSTASLNLVKEATNSNVEFENIPAGMVEKSAENHQVDNRYSTNAQEDEGEEESPIDEPTEIPGGVSVTAEQISEDASPFSVVDQENIFINTYDITSISNEIIINNSVNSEDKKEEIGFPYLTDEQHILKYNDQTNNLKKDSATPSEKNKKLDFSITEIVVPLIHEVEKETVTDEDNVVKSYTKNTIKSTEMTSTSHSTTTTKSTTRSQSTTTRTTTTKQTTTSKPITTNPTTTKQITSSKPITTSISTTTSIPIQTSTSTTTSKPTHTSIPITTSKSTSTDSSQRTSRCMRSSTIFSTAISVTDIQKIADSSKTELKNSHKNKKVKSEGAKQDLDPYFDIGVKTEDNNKDFRNKKNKKELDTRVKEDDLVLVPDMRNVDLDFDIEEHPREKNLQTTVLPTTTQMKTTLKLTTSQPITTQQTTTTEKLTTQMVKGEWITHEWSECSTTCGVGARIRQVKCSLSNNKLCNQTDRPPPAVLCNLRPCAKWVYGQWTKCSSLCGAGTRTKKIECVDPVNKKLLRPHHCRSQPPLTTVKISCTQSKCMPWKTSRWSSCSKACGPGIQLRRVACSRYDQCDPAIRPQQKKSCFVKKCVYWRPLVWNKCSVHCGGGLQRRQVICIEQATGIQTNSSECSPGLRPHRVRKCNQGQCPVTDYDFSSCHKDRLSSSFCKLLESLGRCVQPSLAIQCCVTCKTFLSVRHKDKIS